MSADIFTNFLQSLRAPLRENSAIAGGIAGLMARACARLWEDAQSQLKSSFPRFFRSEAELRLWAEERGIEPIRHEEAALYAKRTARAFSFLASASTRQGIERMIAQVMPKPFLIRELYTENWLLGLEGELLGESTIINASHSAFIFVVEFQGLSLAEKEYLEALIALYKPAHTVFRLEAKILDDWLLGSEGELLGISTYL